MRIVIDLQGAQTDSRFRGIGRYTMSLTQAIVRNKGEHEIILALSGLFPDTIEPIRAAFDGVLPQENIRVWYAPGPVREEHPGNDSRRETAELIREAFLASLQPDVIHISSLFEGYVDDAVTSIGRFDTSTPVSVILFDLIPLLNPDHYLKFNSRYKEYYLRKVEHLRRAVKYLAISDFSCEEGLEALGVSGDGIVSISTAVDPHFQPKVIDETAADQFRQKFGITRLFVLYTGGADERKNLPRLIEAYAALPKILRSSHQLVFTGNIPAGDVARLQHIARSCRMKTDEILFVGHVTDEELVQLYNLCRLYVFPSWHEGFGMPVLEAMACGAPVICAGTSSLPEVMGLDDALFNPFDVTAITHKMAKALEDDAFRVRLCNHGLQQARKFSWDESAKRAIAAWELLIKTKPQNRPICRPTGHRPRLAFVSPLPPERTGIADYSAELLPALAEHYDIEVVVAKDNVDDPWVNRNCTVRDVSWLRKHTGEIDRVLYQIGNSPFHQHMLPLLLEIPGTVVLHDFYLSSLMEWLELHAGAKNAWTEALYAAHGYGAVRDRYLDAEATKRKYPVNLCILKSAHGLIVHSEYSRKLMQQWYGDGFLAISEVIPHLRSPADTFDKAAARKQLGIDKGDFLICSFGFLDSTKLNHRLLNAWLNSALSADKRCKLVFVGENNGGAYGTNLLRKIQSSGLGNRIRITGFASPEKFRQYLMAADVAVQLRTQSRGETSGVVLHCMNHATPLIVNANGSIAELDTEAVWMLPDEFDDAALVEALETLYHEAERRRILGQRAREVILTCHSPAECANRYAEAIERFHHRAETATPALIRAIAMQKTSIPTDTELILLAKNISTTLPQMRPSKRLYLDISATIRNDLKTGIERVARALLLTLLETPPAGYRIEPVYLSDVEGEWRYRYARRYTLDLLGCPTEALADEIVDPECGDVLLGLDLSGDTLAQAERSGLFAVYRNRGVAVYFVVFDLLPVRMPEVFPPGAGQAHTQWLQTISRFDGAICISKAVADDLAAWQAESGYDWKHRRPFSIGWFHLGADFSHSAFGKGLPDNAERTLRRLRKCPTFLMVGTIEPRKGYQQAIEAFTILWDKDFDVNLAIVGSKGWMDLPDAMRRDIPETINHLRTHPELNKRLFWLEGISDEYLEKVYTASNCLIAASYGEGFGLPLIEAAQHKLHIIARDIPVFHEVAGKHAFYFQARNGSELAKTITDWLEQWQKNNAIPSEGISYKSWQQSANTLIDIILRNH